MGYDVSESLSACHTLRALKIALGNRCYRATLIHHSDRGLQYCSAGYVKTLKEHAITISMTEDGSPYDNAIAERVNGILKDEFGLDEVFNDPQQLELQVKQAIESYNFRRPHESNYLLTPYEMHLQNKLKPKACTKNPIRTLKVLIGFYLRFNIN